MPNPSLTNLGKFSFENDGPTSTSQKLLLPFESTLPFFQYFVIRGNWLEGVACVSLAYFING